MRYVRRHVFFQELHKNIRVELHLVDIYLRLPSFCLLSAFTRVQVLTDNHSTVLAAEVLDFYTQKALGFCREACFEHILHPVIITQAEFCHEPVVARGGERQVEFRKRIVIINRF